MASMAPTYASDGNGTVLAFHGNHVIASGTDFAKVSESAEEYFSALRSEHAKKSEDEDRKTATHITTPNGEKGTILGRTASVFANEITVRFENGQIRHYDTFTAEGLKFSKEAADAPKSPIEYFQRQLEEVASPGIQGLTARLNTLNEIRRDDAHLAIQGVSLTDGQELHQIVLTADAERHEVGEALEYLVAADAEAIAPPQQAYSAVEQVSLGHSNDWLEIVAQEMVAESEAQDFDRLLEDGPVEFVSSLETAALANTGVVSDMARDHITAKTAGFQGETVDNYRDEFVAAVEVARKREASYRRDVTHKEAAVTEASITDAPDEALFM